MRSAVEEGAARAMKAGESQIPKVLAAGELLQGLALGRLDSCMGGFRKPWNEIKTEEEAGGL